MSDGWRELSDSDEPEEVSKEQAYLAEGNFKPDSFKNLLDNMMKESGDMDPKFKTLANGLTDYIFANEKMSTAFTNVINQALKSLNSGESEQEAAQKILEEFKKAGVVD